jgi:hypothetical protein
LGGRVSSIPSAIMESIESPSLVGAATRRVSRHHHDESTR